MNRAPIRVLGIEDSALGRKALCDGFAKDPELQVAGQAGDPCRARDLLVELRPDVIMLDALEAGAVDIVAKPTLGIAEELSAGLEDLRRRLDAAAVDVSRFRGRGPAPLAPQAALYETTDKVIAIGASTGGVQALTRILPAFAANGPSVVVVQHMPAGERHMKVARSGGEYRVALKAGPEVCFSRPLVDVPFRSVAAGRNASAAALTGMGRNGAAGLTAIREAGGRAIVQNEASCVVYGMSKAALDAGAAETAAPFEQIPDFLTRFDKRTRGWPHVGFVHRRIRTSTGRRRRRSRLR